MKLSKNTKIIIIAVLGLITLVLLYVLLYSSLIGQLKKAAASYEPIEREVRIAREIISSLEAPDTKEGPVTAKDISLAIGELTRKGKAEGVDFISITPKKAINKDGFHKVLPLEVNAESKYEELGLFLGSLDELEKSIIVVRSFQVRPDAKDPFKLRTSLVLNIYLEEAKDAE